MENIEKELSKQNKESEISEVQKYLTITCSPVLQQGYSLLEAVPGAKVSKEFTF